LDLLGFRVLAAQSFGLIKVSSGCVLAGKKKIASPALIKGSNELSPQRGHYFFGFATINAPNS
jgi:hypothetical protein